MVFESDKARRGTGHIVCASSLAELQDLVERDTGLCFRKPDGSVITLFGCEHSVPTSDRVYEYPIDSANNDVDQNRIIAMKDEGEPYLEMIVYAGDSIRSLVNAVKAGYGPHGHLEELCNGNYPFRVCGTKYMFIYPVERISSAIRMIYLPRDGYAYLDQPVFFGGSIEELNEASYARTLVKIDEKSSDPFVIEDVGCFRFIRPEA